MRTLSLQRNCRPPPPEVEAWAQAGNAGLIPAEKLANAPSGGGASALSFTPIQATTNSIGAAESGAYVFTVSSGLFLLGLPEGEYFMQARTAQTLCRKLLMSIPEADILARELVAANGV